ncbi:hypothetical protein FRB90_010010, partial [Tulasnella sp. 427]
MPGFSEHPSLEVIVYTPDRLVTQSHFKSALRRCEWGRYNLKHPSIHPRKNLVLQVLQAMPANAVAENILGTIGARSPRTLTSPARSSTPISQGTICWTLQIVPQIWKSWRAKSTEGLSAWLMFIWAISGIPLGVYVIVQNINIPV